MPHEALNIVFGRNFYFGLGSNTPFSKRCLSKSVLETIAISSIFSVIATNANVFGKCTYLELMLEVE